MNNKELDIRFTYHKPIGNQADRYEWIRNYAREFAESLSAWCPESRELSLALTNLEQAVMWANSAIARRECSKEDCE